MNKKIALCEKIGFLNNEDLPPSVQNEIFREAERVFNKKNEDESPVILLIGGAGYIGSVLTKHLLDKGYKVRCYDNLIYRNSINILHFINDTNYEFIYGDLCNKNEIETAMIGINSVILLAGLVGDPITKKYPEIADKINNIGVKEVISLLDGKGINKLVFISTCSNYGLVDHNVLADENYELKPLSLYAQAKVDMEKYILSLKDKVDFHPTILRFATAFGLSPRMRFDLTVSEFVYEIFYGKDLLVYDANTWRPYCHVEDFSTLIRRVIEFPVNKTSFEVFNAGGDMNNFTKQGIVDLITEFLPGNNIRYKEQGSDPRNYRVDFSKVKETLYFEPEYTVEAGIKELINALNQHIFDHVESNRNDFGNYEITYPSS